MYTNINHTSHTPIHTHTHTHILIDRQAGIRKQTDRQTNTHTHTHTYTHTDGQAYANKQTDRQTNTHTHTHTHILEKGLITKTSRVICTERIF